VKKFLSVYHRQIVWFGFFLLMAGATCYLTGCAGLPVWLSDAETIVPQILLSAGAIITAIGSLTGNPEFGAAVAELNAIGKTVESAIQTLQQMVAAYKANPGTTPLTDVEQAAQAVISNASNLLADFGIPATASAPFVNLAQLIISQMEAWISTFQIATAPGGSTVSVTVPMTAAEYKTAHNAIAAQHPAIAKATI
jgi:hypothetical protein